MPNVPRSGFPILPVVLCAIFAVTANAASLNVSPGSGAGGAPVSLSASGFDEDYNTGFYVVGPGGLSFIGACPFDNRANCTLNLAQLPAYTPGTVTLRAANSAAQAGEDTYQVAEPKLSMAPRCGPPGTPITVTGRFYGVGTAAGIYFDNSLIPASATNYPSTTGTFTFTFPAPAAGDGSHIVRASNSAGNSLELRFGIGPECPVVGEVTKLEGDGRVFGPLHPPEGTPLAVGTPLRMGDRVETGGKGAANMLFADNTSFSLSRNGKLQVDEFSYEPQQHTGTSFFSLLQGVFVHKSGDIGANSPGGEHGTIHKPAGAIGIRGTEFAGRYDPATETGEVYLTSGQVSITPWGTGLTTIHDAPVAITFTASGATTGPIVDLDADASPDPVDNCQGVTNASQCDSDGDGYGNRCDGDMSDNAATNAQDYVLFRQQLGQPSLDPSYNEADINCNGTVNAQDYVLFRGLLGVPPGPSGLAP